MKTEQISIVVGEAVRRGETCTQVLIVWR